MSYESDLVTNWEEDAPKSTNHVLDCRDAACVPFDGEGTVITHHVDECVGCTGIGGVINDNVGAALGEEEGSGCPNALGATSY